MPKKKKPTQKKLDRQAELRTTASEAKVELFVEQIRSFLQRNLMPILADLATGKHTVKEAAKVLGGLESAMEDAGFGEAFERAKDIFSAEYEAVAREFTETTGKAGLLSGLTRGSIDALVDDRLMLASTYVTDYLGDVRSIILDSIVAGKAFKIPEVLQVAEGRHFAYLRTEVNTTLMAYQRIVHMEKAKKLGLKKFIYIGPEDDITRPFCLERVDRVYSEDEIAQMDNEQNLPVSVYCGGYNCRHHWRPVSDDLAREFEAEKAEEDGVEVA